MTKKPPANPSAGLELVVVPTTRFFGQLSGTNPNNLQTTGNI